MRNVYTVMAGCGVGEFLWCKKFNEECLVGGNVFCRMDSAADQELISEELFHKLFDWAGEYMAGKPKDSASPSEIDWERFNAGGMDLARMLKNELGDGADVQYVRADEDPDESSLMLLLKSGNKD